LQGFSRERSQEFELDGTFVGDIRDGTMSTTLRKGLIEPWEERCKGG
jgi:hypothetical protein